LKLRSRPVSIWVVAERNDFNPRSVLGRCAGEAVVGDEIQDAIGTAPGSIGCGSSDEAGEGSGAGQPNTPTGQSPAINNSPAQSKRLRTRLLIGGLGALILAIATVLGVPWIKQTLNTVSTDDAYVNGHVTFVAARVPGQVSRVLVDDNNRVRTGDLLAELDREPYEVIVATKSAAVETAKADLAATMAAVRGVEARTRGLRWKLQHAIEDVDNQIKLLHTKIAVLDKSKATLKLAEVEFERVKKLLATGLAASREQYDQREATLSVARADVTQSLADIYQIRVSLGLPATPGEGGDLSEVPSDLDQTYSAVRQAQSELIESAAELGVIHSYIPSPKQMVDEFEKREGSIDKTFAKLVSEAPAVKQAEAKLASAERDLDQADLNLRYCRIIAEIDGVITRRNVNPGNNVLAGQGLMAIRSLNEIWIDANFKETQLRDLRIGQAVDLYADIYGGRRVFAGRISGFTIGTGSTLALLPPQNATGNFVKVVQRLPVRIELQDYDPDKEPLFIGLSVVPYVYLNKPPTGQDAGKVLQASVPQSSEIFTAGSRAAQNK
jgi:membrane fusion protein, multidrug efflux system